MNDEHAAMLSCSHPESDQLGPVCIGCGAVSLPDPSYLVIAASVVMFAWNLYAWWAM